MKFSGAVAGDYKVTYDDGESRDTDIKEATVPDSEASSTQPVWAVVNVKPGTDVTITSMTSSGSSNEVWAVSGSQVEGRGAAVKFEMPSEDGSTVLTRINQGGTVINSIGTLEGGLSDYGDSDFEIV